MPFRFAFCAWHKDNPMPVANKHYKPDTEFYIHAWNKNGFPIGKLEQKSRYVFSQVGKSEYDHPTVKPNKIMDKILSNVQGAVICDPFMGTASTGAACIKDNRTFIGIEKNEAFFDIACKRIRDAYAQPDFFVQQPIDKLSPSQDLFAAQPENYDCIG
jgi:DNA modification methylase